MRKMDIRILTLSFIVFNLLFFSFVHGVFRLQLFKHTVNSELLEKLQVETLHMAAEYQDIQSEADLALKRTLDGNKDRSHLVAEQIAGLIASTIELDGPLRTPEQKANLLANLSEYNSAPEDCFWILDEEGAVVLGPRPNLTDVVLNNGKVLVSLLRNSSEGEVFIPGKGNALDNPGYGKRVSSLGWTIVSFQPMETLSRKVQGFDSLKKLRTDRLITQMGRNGTAGVVDKNLMLKEFTFAQMKGRHVDDIRIEGPKQASELLFNKQDGMREYVIEDFVSKRAKYRQSYMHYDPKTGDTYFIAQNKSGLFKDIDSRSSPLLGYLGGLSLLILTGNTVYGVREILRRGHGEGEQ